MGAWASLAELKVIAKLPAFLGVSGHRGAREIYIKKSFHVTPRGACNNSITLEDHEVTRLGRNNGQSHPGAILRNRNRCRRQSSFASVPHSL
jgi:hypothetical protein